MSSGARLGLNRSPGMLCSASALSTPAPGKGLPFRCQQLHRNSSSWTHPSLPFPFHQHQQQQQHQQQLLLTSRRRPFHTAQTAAAAGGGAGSSGSGSGGSSSGKGGSGGSNGGSSSSGGGDGGLWGAYLRALEASPLLVKAITTAILSAIGNIICQLIVEKQEQFDWKRFNTFTGLGFCYVAPALHVWYGVLNKLVAVPGNKGALIRMALDQLCYAPLFIGSMMAILLLLEGKADQIQSNLRSDLPGAVKANWGIWGPAQFLNFRFVPPQQQVLFANCVSLIWNVYFSFATRPKEATA